MTTRIISTDKAPAAIGPYSQAVADAHTLYCSGQIGLNPVTGELIEPFEAQAHQAFSNLKAVIEAAGSKLENVMKLTIFLSSMDDFPVVNDIMCKYFAAPYPARSCFAVAALPKGARVEVEAIVHLA